MKENYGLENKISALLGYLCKLPAECFKEAYGMSFDAAKASAENSSLLTKSPAFDELLKNGRAFKNLAIIIARPEYVKNIKASISSKSPDTDASKIVSESILKLKEYILIPRMENTFRNYRIFEAQRDARGIASHFLNCYLIPNESTSKKGLKSEEFLFDKLHDPVLNLSYNAGMDRMILAADAQLSDNDTGKAPWKESNQSIWNHPYFDSLRMLTKRAGLMTALKVLSERGKHIDTDDYKLILDRFGIDTSNPSRLSYGGLGLIPSAKEYAKKNGTLATRVSQNVQSIRRKIGYYLEKEVYNEDPLIPERIFIDKYFFLKRTRGDSNPGSTA